MSAGYFRLYLVLGRSSPSKTSQQMAWMPPRRRALLVNNRPRRDTRGSTTHL